MQLQTVHLLCGPRSSVFPFVECALLYSLKSLALPFGTLALYWLYFVRFAGSLRFVVLPNDTHFLCSSYLLFLNQGNHCSWLSEEEEYILEFPLLRCLIFFCICNTCFVFLYLKSALSSRCWSESGTVPVVALSDNICDIIIQKKLDLFTFLSLYLQSCVFWIITSICLH